MNLKKIIILIMLILIIGILFYFVSPLLTGKTIQKNQELNNYIHTRAICNDTNFCQDYIITCKKNKIISAQPITGAIIQHSKDWKDPRKNPEKLCN